MGYIMNTIEIFKAQTEQGSTEMFLYAVERNGPFELSMRWHKGTLDSFPDNLEFVRMASEKTPIFKELA